MRLLATAALGVAAVIAACASFEATDPSAVPDGAGAPDGSTPDDAAGDAVAPACVPERIEPTDAGPEPTQCGGQEVDLETSDEHCGFCGNRCAATNPCSKGACVGELVAQGPEEAIVVTNAVNAGNLYFAAQGPGCATGSVLQVPLGGVGAQPFLDVAGCADHLEVHDNRLVYMLRNGGIRATALDAPSARVVIDNVYASGFHFTATALFWRYGSGTINRANVDGSGSSVVQDRPGFGVHYLTGDEDSAWWLAAPTDPDAGPAPQELWTRSNAGGSTIKRLGGLAMTVTIVVHEGYVYIASTDGLISRVTKQADGSAAEPIGRLDLPNKVTRALVVHGDYVYVAVSDLIASDFFDLYRVKKCGGRARRVSRDYMSLNGLVSAGNHIYFNANNRLVRFEPTK